MAPQCIICHHLRRKEIETAIINGTSNVRIGSTYHMSEGAVRKHKKNHMAVIKAVTKYPRVQAAAKEAVDSAVDQYQGMTLIPAKWKRLEGEYEKMLKEAEDGPDFSDAVLQAVEGASNGNKKAAAEMLAWIRKHLVGDRKDRRETLKEMRALYDNQIQAMSRLEELRESGRVREPIKITYRLISTEEQAAASV